MWFAVKLCRQGFITSDQLLEAIERHFASRPPIGKIAMATNRLTMKEVFHILDKQAETGQQFGDLAIDLGYLTQQDLAVLLFEQERQAEPMGDILVAIGAISAETYIDLRTSSQSAAMTRAAVC